METKNKITKENKPSAKKDMVKPKSDAATGLHDLFEDGLKDIYWAEKALTKALPKMMKNASSPDLVKAIESHLLETEVQIERILKIFDLIDVKAVAVKCDAMEGLIKEGEGIVEETEIGVVRDAGIIAASQKIEHYEIATYGTLKQFATTLGYSEVAKLLELSLDEEKSADVLLTKIAVKTINIAAEKLD